MAQFRVLWAPQALDDLKDIYDYIYEHSPKGADRIFDTLLDLGDSLADMPERFPVEPLLEQQPHIFRFIPKWNYKIIYRVNHTANLVIIAKIFSTRQNPTSIEI